MGADLISCLKTNTISPERGLILKYVWRGKVEEIGDKSIFGFTLTVELGLL